MSKVDELKSKNENLFERNTILLNENERLKKENAENKVADMEIVNGLCNQIQDLQKENAELKEILNIRSCQNCRHNNRDCPNDGSCKHYSKWEGYENPQLAQAKELLEQALPYLENTDEERDELYDKIEQFLKEIDK